MQIHDFSEIKTVDGKLKISDRILGMLKFGMTWSQDVMAQETFIEMVGGDIDKRSYLIRNFPLAEASVNIPLLLIGPPGLSAILLTRDRGIYRAKEDQWLSLSGKSFRPSKDNLIHRAQLYARATQKYLGERGFPDIVVESVIVGVHPGLHVDTQRPAVRIIQADAIRRFGAQWHQKEAILTAEQIYQIVATISREVEPEETDTSAAKKRRAYLEPREDPFDQRITPLKKTFDFNTKQWGVLGLLLAGTVLILLIFMLFIVLTL